ncbi:hypothetical protein WR25_21967 [Diploscapter pachys]|uniref:C-type lectin domain-containing protein n=1 Tax=Diploscapter pachys TaxID=2018661 RepID=A0A2A2KMY3_9BILA|nr:hypothetical protein WR25_21967 [Diploscapter pachys]
MLLGVESQAAQRFSASHFIIGLYRSSPTSQYWYWYNGDWFTYRNWDTNEPAGVGTIAIASKLTGKWSASFNDYSLPFVCESNWYTTEGYYASSTSWYGPKNEHKQSN